MTLVEGVRVDVDAYITEYGEGQDWRTRAACKDMTSLFFPGHDYHRTEEAKRVCARCEVRNECRTFALEYVHDNGIWGGLTEKERNAERKRLAKAGDVRFREGTREDE
jgi:WhiB family redox-sensing transcriptional regulator